MALYTFLRNHPKPTVHQLEESMDGNLCRYGSVCVRGLCVFRLVRRRWLVAVTGRPRRVLGVHPRSPALMITSTNYVVAHLPWRDRAVPPWSRATTAMSTMRFAKPPPFFLASCCFWVFSGTQLHGIPAHSGCREVVCRGQGGAEATCWLLWWSGSRRRLLHGQSRHVLLTGLTQVGDCARPRFFEFVPGFACARRRCLAVVLPLD